MNSREDAARLPLDAVVDLMIAAEYEITAFQRAVADSYGEIEAELAAWDWLEEMQAADWSVPDAPPNWRQFTIAAASKLADRMRLIECRRFSEESL